MLEKDPYFLDDVWFGDDDETPTEARWQKEQNTPPFKITKPSGELICYENSLSCTNDPAWLRANGGFVKTPTPARGISFVEQVKTYKWNGSDYEFLLTVGFLTKD